MVRVEAGYCRGGDPEQSQAQVGDGASWKWAVRPWQPEEGGTDMESWWELAGASLVAETRRPGQ